MNPTDYTTTQLRQALKLLERKETIQAQVAALEQQLARLVGGSSSGLSPVVAAKGKGAGKAGAKEQAAKGAKPRKASSREKRGSLKEAILTELKAAGQSGLGLKELAGKLQRESRHVSAWFASTGKKLPNLKKIGRGIYSLVD